MDSSPSPIVAEFARAAREREENRSSAPSNEAASSLPRTPTESSAHAHLPETAPVQRQSGKQAAYNVLTLFERAQVARWMIDEAVRAETDKRIQSKAISHFPSCFRGSPNANFMRAKRIWAEGEKLMEECPKKGEKNGTVMHSVAKVSKVGKKLVFTKEKSGRGRKQSEWVIALHIDLLSDFERLRKVGMKFSVKTLTHLAKSLILKSTNSKYSASMTSGKHDRPISELVNYHWTHRLMDHFSIVLRRQTGKLMLLPEAQLIIEKRVAFFLGKLARDLQSGAINEEDIENADETHFVINVDNGVTLGFRGDEEVKYADVTSGGEGMTMMVRLSRGANARIEVPMMIFKNKDSNYPIRDLSDDVPGVCYRTGPKGWISKRTMLDWVQENRAHPRLPNGRRRVLFTDNCSSHSISDELKAALESKRTELRFIPSNETHLLQPCDSFVIHKIKAEWSERWDGHKMDTLRKLIEKPNTASNGLLPNPGKRFFLKLAADAVRDVNSLRDENGQTYARKAMVRCGFSKQQNGLWEVQQLFPHLQNIVAKHRQNFHGADPDVV